MKLLKLIIFFWLINTANLFAQHQNHVFQLQPLSQYHYFIINASSQKFEVNKVDAESSNELDCDKKVFRAELFNVRLSKGRLVLFSILPSPVDGLVHWSAISLDEFPTHVLNARQLDSLSLKNLKAFQNSGYTNTALVKLLNIKLIIKKADGYYIADNDCLTELFVNDIFYPNSGFANQNPITHIDTSIVPLSIAEFENQYFQKNNKSYSYNNPYGEYGTRSFGFKMPLLLYSHKSKINNTDVQYFWTLDGWNVDGLNSGRGIDRFIFNPDIGIIGGDYTFYFKQIFKAYQSSDCEKLKFKKYLNNEMKLMPVKVTKNVQKE